MPDWVTATVQRLHRLDPVLPPCAAHIAMAVITQSSSHVNFKLISHWIKSILRVFQKFLKHFNGTAISAYFLWLSFVGLPIIPVLNLKDSESVIGLQGPYLQWFRKLTDILEWFLLYSIKLYIDITISKSSALSIKI